MLQVRLALHHRTVPGSDKGASELVLQDSLAEAVMSSWA